MEYTCPARPASAEIEAKRSRFIGTVAPAFTIEEAESHVAAVRRRYPDAAHNAYAYSVGTGTPIERVSDDREPRRTAGYPVLEVIKKRGLRNVACVVTRYFGGTLLGSGGLLRAYGKAASAALDAAGTARYVYHKVLSVTVDYDRLGRLQKELEGRGMRILDTSYAERVEVKVYVTPEGVDDLIGRVQDMTSGKARFALEEGRFVPS